jgi:hypothetical protein
MTGANLAGTPVWAAALNTAACHANRSDGVSSVIQWIAGAECVRYTASDDVTVEPFGIVLAQGMILEVRWPAGDTGYSVGVRQPESNPSKAKVTMRLSSSELIDTLRARISTPDQRSKRAQVNPPQETGRRLKARRCKCGGTCRTCVDNARWERVFQQKFADPTYYSHPSTRVGSSLAGH